MDFLILRTLEKGMCSIIIIIILIHVFFFSEVST